MVMARNVESGVELRLDCADLRCILPCGVPVTLEGVLGTTVRVVAFPNRVTVDTVVGPGNESIKRILKLDTPDTDAVTDSVSNYYSVEHLVGDCLVSANGML